MIWLHDQNIFILLLLKFVIKNLLGNVLKKILLFENLRFVAVAPIVKTRTISLCLRLGSREINGVNCPFAEARRHSHFSPMFSSPFRVERRSFTSASRFTRLSTLERAKSKRC